MSKTDACAVAATAGNQRAAPGAEWMASLLNRDAGADLTARIADDGIAIRLCRSSAGPGAGKAPRASFSVCWGVGMRQVAGHHSCPRLEHKKKKSSGLRLNLEAAQDLQRAYLGRKSSPASGDRLEQQSHVFNRVDNTR
jgi:hypothetical protein